MTILLTIRLGDFQGINIQAENAPIYKKKGRIRRMTERQQLFCKHYLESSDVGAAATLAGYPAKTAQYTGSRLLKNPRIQKYIQNKKELQLGEKVANGEEILEFLTQLLRGDIPDAKTTEKLKAAELLGRRHLLFADGKAVEGKERIFFRGEQEI